MQITRLSIRDARFPLHDGAGGDAVHTNPHYSYAVAQLETGTSTVGIGLAFTLGGGNDLVCQAIQVLGGVLVGREIEALMAEFGTLQRRLADDPQYRWLGPHKGVVQLALAAITNACWDLWAKSRGVPLWKLLLDLTPEQLVATLDLSYVEDELTAAQAVALIVSEQGGREARSPLLTSGYPGYDTSVGWFSYDEATILDNARRALDAGFTALKLKVGSPDHEHDLRRAALLRNAIGPNIRLMLDANQQWTLPHALAICPRLASLFPYWIEEPTHPDDVLGHQTLAESIAPVALASGEHFPNRVIFKNYLQAHCLRFLQADAVRLAGVSEFLVVSLLARKFGLPIVPHVGDMGQLHQHLVLFNHIGLGHEPVFLEYIPHLREHFVYPAQVSGGVYTTPQEPGSSCDLFSL